MMNHKGDNMEAIIKINDKQEYKLLNQGNTAEVYQYAEGRILKLFRDQMPLTPIQNEYRMARIIEEQLACVPRVYEMVEYRERYGIVYEQIMGIDMIQLFLKNIFRIKKYSNMLAVTHYRLQEKDIDVHYSVTEKLCRDIDASTELTDEEKDTIKQYMSTLPKGKKLCHFDYHRQTIKPAIKANLMESDFNKLSAYLYGDETMAIRGGAPIGMPYCAGYACGYHLIKHYLKKTGNDIYHATIASTEEILGETEDFWSC